MATPIIVEEHDVRFGELRLRFQMRTADGDLHFTALAGSADCGGYSITSRSATAATGERRDDVHLFMRIEAGGDRLAISGAAAAAMPVQAFAVVVNGLRADELLTPSDPDLVPPAAHLSNAPLVATYPAELSTPFAAVRCADGRFFVARCANLRVRARRFSLRPSRDAAELVVEEEQRGVDAGPRLMLANWNLGWFDNLEAPVAAQHDAVARLFKVAPLDERTNVPDWVRSLWGAVHLALDASPDAPFTFAEAAATIERLTAGGTLDGTLVTVSGWAETSAEPEASWTPAMSLGGLTELTTLGARCRSAGARLALWVNPTRVPAPSEFLVTPVEGGGGHERTVATSPAHFNPGYEPVREIVVDQVEQLLSAIAPDALVLQLTPAYLNTTGADFAEGLTALLSELTQRHPELGWFVERPRDYLASDAALAFTTTSAIAPGLAPLRTLDGQLVAALRGAGRSSTGAFADAVLPAFAIRQPPDDSLIAQILAGLRA